MSFGLNLIDLAPAVDAAERERLERHRAVKRIGAAGRVGMVRAHLGSALVVLGERLLGAGQPPQPRLRSSTTN